MGAARASSTNDIGGSVSVVLSLEKAQTDHPIPDTAKTPSLFRDGLTLDVLK